MTSNYIAIPNPNTSPIYPKVPVDWRAKLTTQVPSIDAPNGVVLLGKASESGALLEAFNAVFLGAGDDITQGPGVVSLRFYTRRFGDDRILYARSIALNANARQTTDRFNFPLLPSPQTGWRLAPYEELFVGLSTAISGGINVFVFGGQYS